VRGSAGYAQPSEMGARGTQHGHRWAPILGLAVLLLASAVRADEDDMGLKVRMACRTERSFVICSLPVSVPPGTRITYAETHPTSVPDFLQPAGGTNFDEVKHRAPSLKLGFVVKKPGKGTLTVDVLTVICKNSPYCPHVHKTVSATVDVPQG
jgi:hypothetical protein